jgi:hypothetical protein
VGTQRFPQHRDENENDRSASFTVSALADLQYFGMPLDDLAGYPHSQTRTVALGSLKNAHACASLCFDPCPSRYPQLGSELANRRSMHAIS